MRPLDLSLHRFAPVIVLPAVYEVYDFTQGYDPARTRQSLYGVGRYNEKRIGMYDAAIFSPTSQEARTIHMGVDIAAPVGTPVHAFYDGVILMTAIRSDAGDYGGTIITEHDFNGTKLWALHGHLSHKSIDGKKTGARVLASEIIGYVGDPSENGGWNPHLHFQLSWQRPEVCDMPGVVSEANHAAALKTYPDPRLVLGPLYPD